LSIAAGKRSHALDKSFQLAKRMKSALMALETGQQGRKHTEFFLVITQTT